MVPADGDEYEDDSEEAKPAEKGGEEDDKDVVVLTQANFDKVVGGSKFALVSVCPRACLFMRVCACVGWRHGGDVSTLHALKICSHAQQPYVLRRVLLDRDLALLSLLLLLHLLLLMCEAPALGRVDRRRGSA